MPTTFHATIDLHGKTATGIVVPAAAVAALGTSRRPAVVVSLNGYTYRSTVAARGSRYLIPQSAENRAGAGVVAGDEATVTLALDTAPRVAAVPADLAAALAEVPGARARFDALAFSHQREHVRAVEEAKKPETRQRRIARCVEKVQGA